MNLYGDRQCTVLLVLATFVGGTGIILLKSQLGSDPHALGLHTLSMFIPLACCGLLIACNIVTAQLSDWRLAGIALVYIVLALLFYDYFFASLEHYTNDDPDRHSRYAHKIIEKGTLFGWDSLRWGEDVRHYVDQPGYRYYLAGMITLLGGEHRLLQLTSMFLYLSALLFFLREAGRNCASQQLLWIGIFLAVALPYAAKNVIQGLSEWLAVALMLLYAAFYLRRQYLPAVVAIALAPFVRQNLLLVSVVMGVVSILASGRYRLAVPYLLVVLLPVYHNLYYAGELRLLVENKGTLLSGSEGFIHMMAQLADTIAWKAMTYLGYAGDVDGLTLLLAGLFVPLGTALMIWQCFRLRGGALALYVVAALATLGPTMLFGSAYFPRFVFVNQCIILIIAMLLRTEVARISGKDFGRLGDQRPGMPFGCEPMIGVRTGLITFR